MHCEICNANKSKSDPIGQIAHGGAFQREGSQYGKASLDSLETNERVQYTGIQATAEFSESCDSLRGCVAIRNLRAITKQNAEAADKRCWKVTRPSSGCHAHKSVASHFGH